MPGAGPPLAAPRRFKNQAVIIVVQQFDRAVGQECCAALVWHTPPLSTSSLSDSRFFSVSFESFSFLTRSFFLKNGLLRVPPGIEAF